MEKIDKAIEILQAFKEGKTIEWEGESNYFVKWSIIDDYALILKELGNGRAFRIKPEPTYRPYSNAEEFLKASKEHGPYLVTTCDANKVYEFPTRICNDKIHICIRNVINSVSYNDVLKYWKWKDNSPCGILEQ